MNQRINTLLTCVLTLLLFVSYNISSAQFNLTQKPVNPYRFSPENIWDINLVSTITGNVYLEARLEKANLGSVIQATSSALTITPGMNSLFSGNVSTQSLSYGDGEIRSWVDAHQTLPPGRYTICYRVICVEPNCGGGVPIGPDNQYCFEFQIDNPSPLLLNFPSDESVIETTKPQLGWIPPSPVAKEVTYTLRLVKMQKEQSAEDAVLRNIPIIERGGINGNILPYPVDVEELVKGETYAWEVYADLFGERIARSEVWEFTIGDDTSKKREDPFNYIKIRHVNPESTVSVENTLRLDYHEMVSKTNQLTLEVLTIDGKAKGTLLQDITYGENLLDISLGGLGLSPNTEYKVRITNQAGEQFEIKIRYSFSF